MGLAGSEVGVVGSEDLPRLAESTEGGFPAPSTVFGDANKPVQLFGKSKDADDNGDEGGDDDATPESAPAETKPVITLQQQEVTSGEEDEECIFTTDGALYEFVTEDDKAPTWKERGRGELRLNLTKDGGARWYAAEGNFRLILNAGRGEGADIHQDGGRQGALFPCKNAVSGPEAKVTTFALKMRVSATQVVQQVEEFLAATQKALAAWLKRRKEEEKDEWRVGSATSTRDRSVRSVMS